jgi:hypothetical protein
VSHIDNKDEQADSRSSNIKGDIKSITMAIGTKIIAPE